MSTSEGSIAPKRVPNEGIHPVGCFGELPSCQGLEKGFELPLEASSFVVNFTDEDGKMDMVVSTLFVTTASTEPLNGTTWGVTVC